MVVATLEFSVQQKHQMKWLGFVTNVTCTAVPIGSRMEGNWSKTCTVCTGYWYISYLDMLVAYSLLYLGLNDAILFQNRLPGKTRYPHGG